MRNFLQFIFCGPDKNDSLVNWLLWVPLAIVAALIILSIATLYSFWVLLCMFLGVGMYDD